MGEVLDPVQAHLHSKGAQVSVVVFAFVLRTYFLLKLCLWISLDVTPSVLNCLQIVLVVILQVNSS